ncbi:MAG TPA: anthranilate phosphoribosyltransferase [Sphingomonadales bacterium]|nr:anthranilate phosphoribosyltransferase [Sphingomonadales bacterium]
MNEQTHLTLRPQEIEAGYPVSKISFDLFCRGEDISRKRSERLFDEITSGAMNEIEMTALLVALKIKGETPEEIAGAVSSLSRKAAAFPRPDYLFADCCGTGGDGALTFNVSTTVAFLAAACGLPVAKHGNRSVSSRAGSADVLEALGAKIGLSADAARTCLDESGFTFLFAPRYHPAVRHVAHVRRELKTRTVFNILGPLLNPAHPPVQLVGVYDAGLCRPVAATLKLLGCRSGIVVHGGGLDEVALHGATRAAILKDGSVRETTFTLDTLALERHSLKGLAGGSAEDNAEILRAILSGKGTPAQRLSVAANTGVLLYAAGLAASPAEGVAAARAALKAGEGRRVLEDFIRFSKRFGEEAP